MNNETSLHIAIIGLGYVGLPLAVEFSKRYPVTGFDVDSQRIASLKAGKDYTCEVSEVDLRKVTHSSSENRGLKLTDKESDIHACTIFIITVPTPVNPDKQPDLSFLIKASETVGRQLKKEDIVIYESTVYPGCTEECCIPVLGKASGLRFNEDFFCGYSPERINPGDKINTLTKIKKVTSGSTPEIADRVDQLYASIIEAGTYKAPSMKVAEAAKAIENAQRDLNISFMNELALIFDRMSIDTTDVLEAAGTKWNFLKFKPGLVGGHCIGVDPYYLTYKAQSLGYDPQVILSGRNINDSIGIFVANKVIKLMTGKNVRIKGANILILGIAFKENCPDVRNTKITDIYNEFQSSGIHVDIFDPLADQKKVQEEYGIKLIPDIPDNKHYDAIVIAVAHQAFLSINFAKYKEQGTIIFDTKSFIDRQYVDGRL